MLLAVAMAVVLTMIILAKTSITYIEYRLRRGVRKTAGAATCRPSRLICFTHDGVDETNRWRISKILS
jgi:hypothetical protein